MTEVPLTQGKVAFIDDEDAERVLALKWQFLKPGKGKYTGYARHLQLIGGKMRAILMHRFILGLHQCALEVDHKDGNGLNNTRANLRLATRSQNASNIRYRKTSKTGYRGVRVSRKRFEACIKVNGCPRYLGKFDDPAAAARAYDNAAREHFGEFAVLNFPELLETASRGS